MSLSSYSKLNAVVLVGGKSLRMGKDKSLLKYHDNKSQWQHTVSMLEKLVDTVYISVRKGQKLDYPNLLEDKVAGLGPFGAILTALETYPEEAFLVLATDLPFMDTKTLEFLIKNRNPQKNATALQAENKDYPEPLAAIWEPKSVPILQEFYKTEIYKPIQVLKSIPIHKLPVSARIVQNINTLEEYKDARRGL